MKRAVSLPASPSSAPGSSLALQIQLPAQFKKDYENMGCIDKDSSSRFFFFFNSLRSDPNILVIFLSGEFRFFWHRKFVPGTQPTTDTKSLAAGLLLS